MPPTPDVEVLPLTPDYRPPRLILNDPHTPKSRWNDNCKEGFDVEPSETNTDNDFTHSRVHLIGWPNCYDQWGEDNSLSTRSCLNTSEPHDSFKFRVLTSVRDQLHCAKDMDSFVSIKIPISSPGVAQDLIDLSRQVRSWNGSTPGKEFQFLDVHSPDILFGDEWGFRIVNEAGDFVYVNRDTLRFRYYERRGREEYDINMRKRLIHRGFVFKMKFMRERGNRSDIGLLRCTLRH